MKYENNKLEVLKKLDVGGPVRSVSWNTQKQSILAVGQFNGSINLIDADTYKVT